MIPKTTTGTMLATYLVMLSGLDTEDPVDSLEVVEDVAAGTDDVEVRAKLLLGKMDVGGVVINPPT